MNETAGPKRVLVLVRCSPLNGGRAGSAVRMALGLEIKDHQVTVAFLDDGVFAAVAGLDATRAGGEPWGEYVETLHLCGHPLWVEAESLERAGLDRDALRPEVEVVPASRVVGAALGSDAVLAF